MSRLANLAWLTTVPEANEILRRRLGPKIACRNNSHQIWFFCVICLSYAFYALFCFLLKYLAILAKWFKGKNIFKNAPFHGTSMQRLSYFRKCVRILINVMMTLKISSCISFAFPNSIFLSEQLHMNFSLFLQFPLRTYFVATQF